jgi:hypothetical protein
MWNARTQEVKKICLGMKHVLTSGGASLTLRVAFVQESQIFKALVEKETNTNLSPQDTIGKGL